MDETEFVTRRHPRMLTPRFQVAIVLSAMAAGDKIVTSGTLFIDRAATAE